MSATGTTFAGADHEGSIFESSAQGAADAAADARAHAIAAAQNVKDGVSWGVYKAAFGVSFGVVFSGVFLTELLPGQSSLRRGFEDGAADALDAIEARKARRRDASLAQDGLESEHLHADGIGVEPDTRADPAPVRSRKADARA